MWLTGVLLYRFTHLGFRIQTWRSCVLSQIHCVLHHLWTKTVFSKKGQGPCRARAEAGSPCSGSGQEELLWHQGVAVLHVLHAVRAHLLIMEGSQQTILSRRQKLGFRGAFIAAPHRMISSLHDPCVWTVCARACRQGQQRKKEREGERSKRERSESHGEQPDNTTNWIWGENRERDQRVVLGVVSARPGVAAQWIHCWADELKGSSTRSITIFLSQVSCKSLFVTKAPCLTFINSNKKAYGRACECVWISLVRIELLERGEKYKKYTFKRKSTLIRRASSCSQLLGLYSEAKERNTSSQTGLVLNSVFNLKPASNTIHSFLLIYIRRQFLIKNTVS